MRRPKTSKRFIGKTLADLAQELVRTIFPKDLHNIKEQRYFPFTLTYKTPYDTFIVPEFLSHGEGNNDTLPVWTLQFWLKTRNVTREERSEFEYRIHEALGKYGCLHTHHNQLHHRTYRQLRELCYI